MNREGVGRGVGRRREPFDCLNETFQERASLGEIAGDMGVEHNVTSGGV